MWDKESYLKIIQEDIEAVTRTLNDRAKHIETMEKFLKQSKMNWEIDSKNLQRKKEFYIREATRLTDTPS